MDIAAAGLIWTQWQLRFLRPIAIHPAMFHKYGLTPLL